MYSTPAVAPMVFKHCTVTMRPLALVVAHLYASAPDRRLLRQAQTHAKLRAAAPSYEEKESSLEQEALALSVGKISQVPVETLVQLIVDRHCEAMSMRWARKFSSYLAQEAKRLHLPQNLDLMSLWYVGVVADKESAMLEPEECRALGLATITTRFLEGEQSAVETVDTLMAVYQELSGGQQ